MKNIVLAMATEGLDISKLSLAEDKIIEALDNQDYSKSQFRKITCDYQENVVNSCKRSKADALIISEKLPGRKDLIDVLKEVKSVMPNIKIIVLLIKDREVGDLMLAKLAMLGIYNWMPSPWRPNDIAKLVLNPRQLNDVEQYMPKLVENDGVVSMVISSPTTYATNSENGSIATVKKLDNLNANASEGKDLADITPKDSWHVKEDGKEAKSYSGMMKNKTSLFSHQTISQRYHEVSQDNAINFNESMSEEELLSMIEKSKEKKEAADDLSFDLGIENPVQIAETSTPKRQYKSITGNSSIFADIKQNPNKMTSNATELQSTKINFNTCLTQVANENNDVKTETKPLPANNPGVNIRAILNNQTKDKASQPALQKQAEAAELLAKMANLAADAGSTFKSEDTPKTTTPLSVKAEDDGVAKTGDTPKTTTPKPSVNAENSVVVSSEDTPKTNVPLSVNAENNVIERTENAPKTTPPDPSVKVEKDAVLRSKNTPKTTTQDASVKADNKREDDVLKTDAQSPLATSENNVTIKSTDVHEKAVQDSKALPETNIPDTPAKAMKVTERAFKGDASVSFVKSDDHVNTKSTNAQANASKNSIVIDTKGFSRDSIELANEVKSLLGRSRNFTELARNYNTIHRNNYIESERKRCLDMMRSVSTNKNATTIWEAFTPNSEIKTIFCCSILPLATSIPTFLAQSYRKIGAQVNLVDLTREGTLLHSTRKSALEGVVTNQSTFKEFSAKDQGDAINIVYGVAGHGVEWVMKQADKTIIIAPADIRTIRRFIDQYGELVNKGSMMVVEPTCDLSLRKPVEKLISQTHRIDSVAYIRCVNSTAPRTLLTGKGYYELMNETNEFAESIPYVSQAFIVLTGLCTK